MRTSMAALQDARPLRELALDAAIELQRLKLGEATGLADATEFLKEVRSGFLSKDFSRAEHLTLLPAYQSALISSAGLETTSHAEFVKELTRLLNEAERVLKDKEGIAIDKFIEFCVGFHAALMTQTGEDNYAMDIHDKRLKRF